MRHFVVPFNVFILTTFFPSSTSIYNIYSPGKKFAQAMAKFDSKAAGTYCAKDGKKGSYDLFCKDEYNNKKKSAFIPKRFKV